MLKLAIAPMLPLLLLAGCTKPPQPVADPEEPLAKHVLIISIDGCRPDVLLRSQADLVANGIKPNLHQLMSEGCFSFWARTIPASVTLPSHTSMLTGVDARTHGINYNYDKPDEEVEYPRSPTLFELAKRRGLSTSIFASKAKFKALAERGTIDWGYINQKGSGVDDPTIAELAADTIRTHKPNVVFMHLGHSDQVGHGSDPDHPREIQGWGGPLQIVTLQEADRCVGTVVKALKDAGIYEQTLIIVSGDHGGASYSHGANDPRSRHIPWICVGPQVKEYFDLTRHRSLVITTEDTFATACYFLGIPRPKGITGKPIVEVLAERELLRPAN